MWRYIANTLPAVYVPITGDQTKLKTKKWPMSALFGQTKNNWNAYQCSGGGMKMHTYQAAAISF